jgi:hypothetical protein
VSGGLATVFRLLTNRCIRTHGSQEGIRTAALSDIAAAVQMQNRVKFGMRIIDGQYGLPSLPKAEFTLVSRNGEKAPAAAEFTRMLQSMPQSPANPDRRRKNGDFKAVSGKTELGGRLAGEWRDSAGDEKRHLLC